MKQISKLFTVLCFGKKGQAPGTTGFNSNNVPFDVVIKAAKEIYKDYPEILKALGI